jgi:hypothetical protein
MAGLLSPFGIKPRQISLLWSLGPVKGTNFASPNHLHHRTSRQLLRKSTRLEKRQQK